MNYVKSLRETDFEKLGRLKIFSWLSSSEVKALGGSLKMQNFQRNEVIFRESTVVPDAHVLVSGIARVTCLNGRDDRITVALIAPGAIPRIPDIADQPVRFSLRSVQQLSDRNDGLERLRERDGEWPRSGVQQI
jgi:hypothetical protein